VNTLRPTRRAAAGFVIGALTALAAVMLAGLAEQVGSFIVLLVLMVALVGLGLGAAASLYAYVAASVVLITFSTVPASSAGGLSLVELIRYGSFVIGSPIVVLLALRVERQHHAMRAAQEMSAASERRLEEERRAAVASRAELDAALQRVERERARLEEVAESIPEPLIVYDADGRGTTANRAALRLFGRSFVERDLADWGRATEPRDELGSPIDPQDYPQVAAQHGPLRRRMIIRLPMSGRDLLVDVEGTPIAAGGAVLLLRDVGKEVDERRRLSRFASFVAHELRNPLAVARARIELAEREAAQPERAAAHGTRALESVEAAIAVLERLEMYSRADSGMVEAEREPFDLRRAILASVERLRARGSDRKVSVKVVGRPRAQGDRRLAEQAITNLLTNADRYSQPSGQILVTVQDGDPVVVRVADEGPGIAETVADRLFRDRVAVGRGLGLGLYLVQAMMVAQGGSVQLEQRRPAAVFVLRWPRGAAAAKQPQTSAAINGAETAEGAPAEVTRLEEPAPDARTGAPS
jgi:signal transduction histidine kinase